MSLEIEMAWAEANQSGWGQEWCDVATVAIVRKHLQAGMPREDVFGLLRELKEHGFEIREFRHEGARDWPDGEFVPWELACCPDGEAIEHPRRRYAKGVSYFRVEKMYGKKGVGIGKNIAIRFAIPDGDGVLGGVTAALWADSI